MANTISIPRSSPSHNSAFTHNVKPPSYYESSGAMINSVATNTRDNVDGQKAFRAAMDAKTSTTIESRVAIAQLIKSKSDYLAFRFRSMFSRDNPAAEMATILEGSQQRLAAFILEGETCMKIPHNDFHPPERTHARTIFTRNSDKNFLKVFKQLKVDERSNVVALGNPPHQRELVALEIVEGNQHSRVIYAIYLERILPNSPTPRIVTTPPLPARAIRQAPSTLPFNLSSWISDLGSEPGLMNLGQGRFPPSLSGQRYAHNVLPRSPDLAMNDEEARHALTEYGEFILQVRAPRSWELVTVTKDCSPCDAIVAFVHSFKRTGGNVIDIKQSLTNKQSQHVRRLMYSLQTDPRFKWELVEISKYGHEGEKINGEAGDGVSKIHLIAMRIPVEGIKPLSLYEDLIAEFESTQSVTSPRSILPYLRSGPPPTKSVHFRQGITGKGKELELDTETETETESGSESESD